MVESYNKWLSHRPTISYEMSIFGCGIIRVFEQLFGNVNLSPNLLPVFSPTTWGLSGAGGMLHPYPQASECNDTKLCI